MPFNEDFADCAKWSTDENEFVSLSCENGHYHFVAKAAERADWSNVALSEPVDRLTMTIDARLIEPERLAGVGLGCWAGEDEDPPGYRAFIGPSGWNILKENDTGAGATNIPAEASGLDLNAESNLIHVRVDCLAGSDGTTVKIFLNGTLAATGEDVEGIGDFTRVGMLLSARTAPTSVDFDNFHVERSLPGSETVSQTSTSTQAAPETSPTHVVYRETFARQTDAWPKDSHTRVVGGALHVRLENERSALSLSQSLGEQLRRVIIEVKVRQPRSRTGQEQGLSCLKDSERGYAFFVRPDGHVWRISRVTTTEVTEIAGSPDKRDVRAAPAVNRLRAVCEIGAGSQARLTLFVNGTMVGQTTDTATDLPSFDSFSLDLNPGVLGGEAVFDDVLARGS